jgi:hypothetical protein
MVAQINNMKGCEIETEKNFKISRYCIYVSSHDGGGESGLGGNGGGRTLVNPVEKGMKGFISTSVALPFPLGCGSTSSSSSRANAPSSWTIRDTRSSSSCVSWIYSAGGLGISGGGAGTDEDELDAILPPLPLT